MMLLGAVQQSPRQTSEEDACSRQRDESGHNLGRSLWIYS